MQEYAIVLSRGSRGFQVDAIVNVSVTHMSTWIAGKGSKRQDSQPKEAFSQQPQYDRIPAIQIMTMHSRCGIS